MRAFNDVCKIRSGRKGAPAGISTSPARIPAYGRAIPSCSGCRPVYRAGTTMLSSRSTDFAPRDLGERLAATLLRALVRLTVKPILAPHIPIAWQRNWLAGLTRWQRPPRCVEIKAAIIGHVRGEWARPANASSQRATILYLHGGGYCIGSPAMHRAVTARRARSTGLSVFAADYRLAPEYPFPAAVDDA